MNEIFKFSFVRFSLCKYLDKSMVYLMHVRSCNAKTVYTTKFKLYVSATHRTAEKERQFADGSDGVG